MTWQLYIVQCSDGSFYTGIAKDLENRIAQHNRGVGAKYTRGKRPVTLVYCEQIEDRSVAQQREYAIKKLSRTNKIKLIAQQRRSNSSPGYAIPPMA